MSHRKLGNFLSRPHSILFRLATFVALNHSTLSLMLHLGTASTPVGLLHQTPPPLDIQVPPSPPSTSSLPCGPFWRTWRHLTSHLSNHACAQRSMSLTVVSKVTVQYRGQHERFVQQRVDSLFVGHDPHHAILRERPRAIRQESNTLQNVLDHHRFEYV